LTLTHDEFDSLIRSYEREVRAIKKEIYQLCWYSRGGASYDDGMLFSEQDRKIINDIIESNLETTKKSNLPFF
jgi:hypothetical protein